MKPALRLLLALLFAATCSMTGVFASSGEENSKSDELNAPKSTVDKSWKAKIQGTEQRTANNSAHQVRTYREAITEAKKLNVTSVHLDHGYNRALRLDPKTISPNRRPDVTLIYDNNVVRRVKVQSRTDVPDFLRSRNSALDQQLRNNGFTPTPPVVVRPTRTHHHESRHSRN